MQRLLFGVVAALLGVMLAAAPATAAGPVSEPTSQPASATVNLPGWYVTCNQFGTYVRSSPGGPAHTVLPDGTRVHVRMIHNGGIWAFIDYPIYGWVRVIDLCQTG